MPLPPPPPKPEVVDDPATPRTSQPPPQPEEGAVAPPMSQPPPQVAGIPIAVAVAASGSYDLLFTMSMLPNPPECLCIPPWSVHALNRVRIMPRITMLPKIEGITIKAVGTPSTAIALTALPAAAVVQLHTKRNCNCIYWLKPNCKISSSSRVQIGRAHV